MAKNMIFHGLQFGDKQMRVLCAMSEGAQLFGRIFFSNRRGYNPLVFNAKEYRLKRREVVRLLSKGCIKVSGSKINRDGVFYEYELTNHFKKLLSNEN